MKEYMCLVLLCLNAASHSQINDTLNLRFYSNYTRTSETINFTPGNYFVDSVNSNFFPVNKNKYEKGITTIKLREDTSITLGIVEVDSNYQFVSQSFYYINGKKRFESAYQDGKMLKHESWNFKGEMNEEIDYLANTHSIYSQIDDSLYLSEVRVFNNRGNRVKIYVNSRDKYNNPTMCFYSKSNELMTKNYYVIPRDTSYQIEFKYREESVIEKVTITYEGDVIDEKMSTYPIKDLKKSRFYSCKFEN